MTAWLVVWLVVTLVATVAFAAVVIALVRHVLVLGRAARRVGEELGPIVEEISEQGRKASERVSSFEPPRSQRPRR